MTQENKELLLKDLSARLPYGVKIMIAWWIVGGTYKAYQHKTLEPDHIYNLFNDEDIELKPYLRPLSSMTEEERNFIEDKFNAKIDHGDGCYIETYTSSESGVAEIYMEEMIELIGYLNSRHFDYHRKYDEKDGKWKSMIEMGLALSAPDGMYNK